MPKVQKKKCGTHIISISTKIWNLLDAKKGDELNYNITEDGKIYLIKVKKGDK